MDPGSTARRHLEELVFPFWLGHGIDESYGGFFTCFDNRGRQRLSTDKFTWSQGRFVWLLARAARLADRGLLDLDAAELLRHAERGARFLADHAIRPDGTCAYLLDRVGAPHGADKRSIYADCFAAMGLAELTRCTGGTRWLATIDTIVERVAADIASGRAPTPPYPVPAGFAAFGPRMILLNARLDQVHAYEASAPGAPGAARARAGLAAARRAALGHREPDGRFAEMRPADSAAGHAAGTLLARHRTPGHALECVWMALEAGDLLGDHAADGALLASVAVLCRQGWDPEHGGLLRYTDADGPDEPTGRAVGGRYEELVRATWSSKLWWVHSEACYTTGLAAHRYQDAASARWFDRIWDYTLATFPGGHDGAEWIQIRDRAGLPLDEVVALPVKDPYHISRNLMQLVELHAEPQDAAK
ncbi:AGE family epimerase/isomerase [Streptomyces boninensis]|uniref:AGE family epimerase/isomerase n=1 Tax=Streptomyces boninensis TaxID=2039455 RepID=UPI003B2285C5